MPKHRGRPKGSVKKTKPTLSETTLTSSNDEELEFIQRGLNYHSEIAETFASSQDQIDDQVQLITIEYREVEAESSVSQPSGPPLEDPSGDSQRGEGKTTSTDESFVKFLPEGDPEFCETFHELTDRGEMYLEMIKDLSSSKVTEDGNESKNNWYEQVVADMKDYFSEELSTIERELMTPESDLVNFVTGPQDTDLTALSDFESMEPVHEEQNNPDRLIYPGATVTVGVSMLLIITYCTQYHLSGEAMADLLTLISIHCAEVHPGLQSFHNFMKYFHHLKSPISCHKYCSKCLLLLNDGIEHRLCPNDLCQLDLTKHRATSFFIEVPIAKQIQSFFARENFFDDLQYRFRQTRQPGKISDIYDGHINKSLFENNGILSNPNNISLTWNTDGVPLFKSSSFSLFSFKMNKLGLDFVLRLILFHTS